MIKVLIIDGTEDQIYMKSVSKHIERSFMDACSSITKAISYINTNSYTLIVISKCPGKGDLFDVVDTLLASRVNKKASIILVENHPTKAAKLMGMMKGRHVLRLKSNQLEELEKLVEGMVK